MWKDTGGKTKRKPAAFHELSLLGAMASPRVALGSGGHSTEVLLVKY